jgi:A/G-specific adenine glycosylase
VSRASLQNRLLSWYRASKRDLPWRKDVSPYRTWVSEIMLQQTTVAAVIPSYERFLKLFPGVKALAAAHEEKVLRAWAGLGYYSRARNLHKAARRIAGERGGIFPDTFEEVLDLPGVGRYTAGAILSIAFKKPYPVLDGNVMRVFSRLFGLRGDIKKPATVKALWEKAESLLERSSPGDWNQALMELGATVCLPEGPRCGQCPLSADCVARKKGLQEELPVTPKRRDFVALSWTCLWIEKDGKVLLWKRSQDERFLKGLWGFPEDRHLETEPGGLVKKASHTITHHKITISMRRAAPPLVLPSAAAWVSRGRVEEKLVSSLWRKCLPDSPRGELGIDPVVRRLQRSSK